MTVILLRHGRSTSNTAGVLAGRSEGVDLDDKGREQAAGLIDRIGDLPIRALISSPLLRCRRTLEPLADTLCLAPLVDDRLAEVDYGEWTGRKIGELVSEPLWKVVQAHPSAAVFPGDTIRIAVSATRPPAVLHRMRQRLPIQPVAIGSAGAKAMAIIDGVVDAYLHAGGQWEWDSAAPAGVVMAAGMHASRLDGSPMRYNQLDPYLPDFVMCRAELAPVLLGAIRDAWR